MAMMAITPAISRSRELLVQKTTKVAFKLVPESATEVTANRKFFATFVSIVGVIALLSLLIINTLLAQDAFELSHLKYQAKLVSDQREAIDRAIDQQSSPIALAQAAIALGMKASESPTFLDINKLVVATPNLVISAVQGSVKHG